MTAPLACSAAWSTGAGVVHPEARTGSVAGRAGEVGAAEAGRLAEPGPAGEAPPADACGADEWWCSSASVAATPPPARTSTASTIARMRPRRGLGGARGGAGLTVQRP